MTQLTGSSGLRGPPQAGRLPPHHRCRLRAHLSSPVEGGPFPGLRSREPVLAEEGAVLPQLLLAPVLGESGQTGSAGGS